MYSQYQTITAVHLGTEFPGKLRISCQIPLAARELGNMIGQSMGIDSCTRSIVITASSGGLSFHLSRDNLWEHDEICLPPTSVGRAIRVGYLIRLLAAGVTHRHLVLFQ